MLVTAEQSRFILMSEPVNSSVSIAAFVTEHVQHGVTARIREGA